MKRVVIIGAGSYLAQGIADQFTSSQILFVEHGSWRNHIHLLRDVDCVINFAIAPEFSARDMGPDEIIDIEIAKELYNCSTQYVFLSSRKVYGSHTELAIYHENDVLDGFDAYSRNKILTENNLRDLLPGRLTVLRVSNVLGNPALRKSKGTFIGWICEELQNYGVLTIRQNPMGVKDFVSLDFVQKVIVHMAENRVFGTFNVSSNIAIPLGELLGLNVGDLVCVADDIKPTEQFLLDNSKLLNMTGLQITEKALREISEKNRIIFKELRDKTWGTKINQSA